MKSQQFSIKTSAEQQLKALEKDLTSKTNLVNNLETQLKSITDTYKDTKDDLERMSKEKVFLFLQNKELQKILDETKRQLEELKKNPVNRNIDEDSET